jgi:hypothetical protein
MQDKSINGALLALRKQIIRGNLDGMAHVEALLALRGVDMPRVVVREAPVAKRSTMRWMVLDALRDGPKTRKKIVAYVAPLRPDVPPERLYWRVDAALAKLHHAGKVRRNGRLWRVSD